MSEGAMHAMASHDYVVRDNPTELRYELLQDGELVGEILYRTAPGLIALVHTEIEPLAEGRGLGSRLVSGALDDIRARGLRVAPVCPFVLAHLRRHPEHRDLVDQDGAAS
jgi:predicted GNAT family acetyltransferase